MKQHQPRLAAPDQTITLCLRSSRSFLDIYTSTEIIDIYRDNRYIDIYSDRRYTIIQMTTLCLRSARLRHSRQMMTEVRHDIHQLKIIKLSQVPIIHHWQCAWSWSLQRYANLPPILLTHSVSFIYKF